MEYESKNDRLDGPKGPYDADRDYKPAPAVLQEFSIKQQISLLSIPKGIVSQEARKDRIEKTGEKTAAALNPY